MATQTFPHALNTLLAKVVGSSNDREIKRLRLVAARVNALEDETMRLTDDELRETAAEFRARLRERLGRQPATLSREKAKRGGDLDRALDEILPEVFARVREAGRRALGMRHFDVQLVGGAALHAGKIAEMRTGEGKTLAATLAASLNAIAGRGVHVVTANDYLARRDADGMGRIYEALGLTVGCVQRDMADADRREAYAADVTYGTASEFGFDYLRDNMKFEPDALAQRASIELTHHFAIVDEVDSILVDEARTPLIISGPSDETSDRYAVADAVIPRLRARVDYEVDEKKHTATLTEIGIERAERILGVGNLYESDNTEILHCLTQAVKAHTLYRRDKEYVVTEDGDVVIVDANTGRPMPGRRWSDGLHQAVEAKERVKVAAEDRTYATITLQNYFRMYAKLSGMTGTAETEAAELHKIYDLDVVVIPTNREMIRVDRPDAIYRTLREKWSAVVDEIAALHAEGRPVLVGTVSVESSEVLSRMLAKRGIPHDVLNAKHHEREAEIVAGAGRLGAVTIATNMAGRGTDIVLGADPEEHARVVALGGLAIVGTERHEARRIDNQLRGRAGRQGDPGSSRFFLSLEDDLMRIFAGDRMRALLKTLGMGEGVPIESSMVSKRIEGAQRAVEGQNFDARKRTVEYDDVLSKQREAVYGLRRQLLEDVDLHDRTRETADAVAADVVERRLGGEDVDPDAWDWDGLATDLDGVFDVSLADGVGVDRATSGYDEVLARVREAVARRYDAKTEEVGAEAMRWLERNVHLQVLDQHWKDHLLAVDHLRNGVGLAGYAQKDPLVEFKREGYDLFEAMTERIETETLRILFHVRVEREPPARRMRAVPLPC